MAADKLVDSTQLNADLTSVANAIRTKCGTSEALAFPNGFVDAINDIPASASRWLRPNDWPNLDLIDLTDFDGVYLTYDIRVNPVSPIVCVNCRVKNNANYIVERGTIDSTGAFTVLESYTNVGTGQAPDRFLHTMSLSDGNVQLWRIRALDDILEIGFVGSSSAINAAQPCVERAGRLPHITSFKSTTDSPTGTAGASCQFTRFMQRDSIAFSSAVTSLSNVYYRAISLIEVDTNGWDTSNVTNFTNAFRDAANLKYIDLAKIDVSSAQYVTDMFYGVAIENFDVSGWKINSVSNFGYFLKNYAAKRIDLRNLVNSSATNVGWMLSNLEHTESLDIRGWDLSSLTIGGSTFYSTIALRYFNASGVVCPSNINIFANAGFPSLIDYWPIIHKANQNWSSAPLLSHDSLIRIIDSLPSTETALTLTLGAVNKAKLTEQEISAATEKGWTVA